MAAFIIWTAVSVIFVIIGIVTINSKKPAGFWANARAPKASDITDVKKYNRAAAILWIVFAVLFEAVGIPLLFCEQNSPLVFVTMLGTIVLVIGLMIAVVIIENKYRKK